MCATHHIRRLVCVHVLGTPTPPNPKVCVCVCVRTVGNVCKSKVCDHPHPTHPPTQPERCVCACVCVCAYSWECMQVQGMLPSPAHPPTHPTKVCVCVRTVGNVCKSKVCYHPHPMKSGTSVLPTGRDN